MFVCAREREREKDEAIQKFSFAAGTEKQNAGGLKGRKRLKRKPSSRKAATAAAAVFDHELPKTTAAWGRFQLFDFVVLTLF